MLPSCDLFRTGVRKDAENSKSHLLQYSLSLFQIILHSMHKYQPRVHVIRKDFSSDLSPTKPVPVGDGVKTFNFPETVFTTVTAYQNQQVRGCSGEPAASQLSKNLCLDIGEEWHRKIQTRDTRLAAYMKHWWWQLGNVWWQLAGSTFSSDTSALTKCTELLRYHHVFLC